MFTSLAEGFLQILYTNLRFLGNFVRPDVTTALTEIKLLTE